ncbi:hypothetical protein GCM10023311_23590 [Flaviramulus aquimarinus]|uniref:Uncharacterized protein n=1 Tax=Flaviramulus aquimarinus TaxID=1170456 RepID=A0ABP9FAU5_9FLAO
MKLLKEHIAFKIFTLVLTVTLLVPSAVKFAHIFSHHEHEVCNGNPKTHFHKLDVDCEFYKFKLNSQFYTANEYVEFTVYNSYYKINKLTYNFLNNHRQLSFSLRGPPCLV